MSHKVKLEAEEKARLVRKCLREELSCTEAARQADVDRETIKNWIRWYEEEGINAFLSRKNSSYSEALICNDICQEKILAKITTHV